MSRSFFLNNGKDYLNFYNEASNVIKKGPAASPPEVSKLSGRVCGCRLLGGRPSWSPNWVLAFKCQQAFLSQFFLSEAFSSKLHECSFHLAGRGGKGRTLQLSREGGHAVVGRVVGFREAAAAAAALLLLLAL